MRRAGRIDSEDDLEGFGYYSTSVRHQRKWKNGVMVALLTMAWYSCAVVTITTSKEIINHMHFPFLLSTIQFLFASILSRGYLQLSASFIMPPSTVVSLVRQIACFYTLGFILTNSAFSIVSAAFAETIKSSEPISTVLIGMVFFSEGVSLRTYLTLLPITLGIAISCYNNDSFHLLGFILAASSNICFSSRAVLTKKMNLSYPDSLDEVNLFSHISVLGLLLLVPTTIFMEGKAIWIFFTEGEGNFPLSRWLAVVAVNGFMFASYNLLSYLVLRRTDLITHAVLNAFRRVFIILFTSFYFQTSLTTWNLVGVMTAIVGVLLFAYSRLYDRLK